MCVCECVCVTYLKRWNQDALWEVGRLEFQNKSFSEQGGAEL